MSCFWYDTDSYSSTCTYSVGDALHICDCDGNVKECPWQEGGRPIAFEREEQIIAPVTVNIGNGGFVQTYNTPLNPLNVAGYDRLEV